MGWSKQYFATSSKFINVFIKSHLYHVPFQPDILHFIYLKREVIWLIIPMYLKKVICHLVHSVPYRVLNDDDDNEAKNITSFFRTELKLKQLYCKLLSQIFLKINICKENSTVRKSVTFNS